MFRILDDFQKIYYEPMSLPKNVEKSEAMARIQYSECNHYKDRDTKARDRSRFIVHVIRAKTFGKIETANAIFWIYLGGTA